MTIHKTPEDFVEFGISFVQNVNTHSWFKGRYNVYCTACGARRNSVSDYAHTAREVSDEVGQPCPGTGIAFNAR
jgi:hypothetical protein